MPHDENKSKRMFSERQFIAAPHEILLFDRAIFTTLLPLKVKQYAAQRSIANFCFHRNEPNRRLWKMKNGQNICECSRSTRMKLVDCIECPQSLCEVRTFHRSSCIATRPIELATNRQKKFHFLTPERTGDQREVSHVFVHRRCCRFVSSFRYNVLVTAWYEYFISIFHHSHLCCR